MQRLLACVFLLIICTVITVSNAEKSENVNQKDNLDQNLYRSFYTSDNRKISIYNDFTPPSNVFLFRRYLSSLGQWEMTLNNYNNGSDYKEESPDHILWKTFLDPQFMEKSKIGQKLIRAVKHFKGDKQGNDYHIYQAAAKLVTRSEIPKKSTDTPSRDDDVSAIFYLTGKWKKNDYGDIVFYDDNNEIVSAVHPLAFRMVMFDSSIEHLYKPPAIDRYDPLKTIHIKLTKSSEKLRNGIEYYKKKFEHRRNIRNTKLNDIAPVSANRVLNVEKHITQRYVGENGKKIYVLDNLFTPEELEGLRKLVEYKKYFYADMQDDGSDGVSWMAIFSVLDFANSNLWKIHQQVARHVGSRTTYFPYDVSCNLIRNNHRTKVHDDCSQAADQWTMVTYLNPNWTAQMGGETAYFEKNTDDSNYIAEVRPRYGRSVIFQSTIYHSARPPSNDFDGIRYTFSVKMAEDEAQARLNRLSEDFDFYNGNMEVLSTIRDTLRRKASNKVEKRMRDMVLGEDDESPNENKKEEEDDYPSDEIDSLEAEAIAKDEFEAMLKDYRSPHRRLTTSENPAILKFRKKLIKIIDQNRDNAAKMAKLQDIVDKKLSNSYQKRIELISQCLQ
ncbi:uncharacterized protein TRIADDRAFT_57489 [Trichoplax adhaerens]|uniref:Prolyl 4-hydroxylase alpha subunit Fe(2+) 2OG dioxygenase domain-containing protein n=1 Tax=Trichoplax adhaerens TaxID=10228 RepID=B3RZK5_TRIAD|nr:hypothetical protein TRIADDRAFT_57489 [Trichoplax adhaerens]EDV24223.1 hypothetical protein TRIADDRAFT_57489 [Trichoplax adhaerens]|eukprot:XP_002113749.1 hypothetical protein TRIADDRAFT_57489 [Trichoplax adhaerens]